MSVKTQFLKKLQARQTTPVSPGSKEQADIATFRLRMEQLQEQMDGWLTDTGLGVESFTASISDLLVSGGCFAISGIALRYEDRRVTFMPVFLYGQGVAGCVEVNLGTADSTVLLGRLFMRAGQVNAWTFNQPHDLSRSGIRFDENTFFSLISGLLP